MKWVKNWLKIKIGWAKNWLKKSKDVSLTHSPMHHFETIPNSKKMQAKDEMWLLKDFKIQITEKTLWEKDVIAHSKQFNLYPQCFPKTFFLMC